MSLQTNVIFEFGPFRLDSAERLLLRDQTSIHLSPKAFDALVVLVQSRGHLLAKDELLRRVWPDTFVEESNLVQHISMLRRALQDGDDDFQYIETVPRRGYRFKAEVREVCPSNSERRSGPAELSISLDNEGPSHRPGRAVVRAVPIVALAFVLLAWIATPSLRERFRTPEPNPIRSLAVLPLQNLSGDPAQEYFADGLTEDLITELATIPGVKVISRTSIMQYKGSPKRLSQIAQELGVDAIIEGAVVRSGDRVRITAQLVRATTDQHLWAEAYERDMRDLLALQDEVSRSIAAQIEKQIALPVPRRAATLVVSAQAHEDYLKGRYFWNQRSESGYLKAIDYFQAAVSENPQYAQAYAGLADAYALLGSMPARMPRGMAMPRSMAMPKAKEAALTALKLDDTLADAHTSLAFVKMHYEWNFRDAEKEFKRAIDLDPSYSIAHQWYAFDLIAMGRLDEAIAEIKRARQTDPLSAIINTDVAEILYFARDYDAALAQALATVEMDSNFAHAHRVLGRIYDRKRMFPAAIAEGKRAVALSGEDAWILLDLANTYAEAGDKVDMRNCIARAATASPGGKSPDFGSQAGIFATLGEPDRAFEVLDARYAARDGALILLNADPDFDPLKSDSRFKDLAQRVGLPR
jgi:TolB-like protein/DNA-binding winged helix-turn-helix (wHTH) protein/Flp pilus assembly protein TadD